jgi:hypothetical protein
LEEKKHSQTFDNIIPHKKELFSSYRFSGEKVVFAGGVGFDFVVERRISKPFGKAVVLVAKLRKRQETGRV